MMESMKIGKQMVALLVIYAFLFQHVHASIIGGTSGTNATEDRAFKSDEIGKCMHISYQWFRSQRSPWLCAVVMRTDSFFFPKRIKWFLTHNSFVDWFGLQNKKSSTTTTNSDQIKCNHFSSRNRSNIWCNKAIPNGAVAHHVQIGRDVGGHYDDIVPGIQGCLHRNADPSIELNILCHQIWIIPETRSLHFPFTWMVTTNPPWPRLGTTQRCTFAHTQWAR